MVEAALRLSGSPLRRAGLTLVLVAGEETGCEGAAHLREGPGALGRAGALVVGEPTGNRPVIGPQGRASGCVRARAGHSARVDAADGGQRGGQAARAVLELSGFRFEVPPDPLLGSPTLNIGTFQGGLNVNSVPDEAVIGIAIRTVPAQKHAQLRGQIEALLGPEVELTPSLT